MLKSFKPIINQQSKIIILGSMPGEESLRLQQYYGYKYNVFWLIMFELLNEPYSEDYEIRIKLLLDHKIALWDVIARCEREGSLDSQIKRVVPNKLDELFNHYPNISHVFLNGRKAEALFKKNVQQTLSNEKDLNVTYLPSTSPANARMRYPEKKEKWAIILKAIK